MVLQGERTRKLRSLGPLDAVLPMNHFKKGSMTPAMSSIDVNVFSNIKAETCWFRTEHMTNTRSNS